ncbi:hypothetical protein DL96DRAFT_1748461 [Flagelloscypha sp. PMI_526]|nr:hypothetical protein DL96DRAFT_1748461 [Flagelloscypha sp. PMI_526]
MPKEEKPGLAVLSLDGGRWENHGALTQIHVVEDILYKYEVDNNLEEGSARVADVFDLVVGTGIGGQVLPLLVGCMLGPLKMSTRDAKQAYLWIYASKFLARDQLSERAEVLKGALGRMLDSSKTVDSTTKMASIGKITTTCKFAVTTMMAANLTSPIMLRGYLGRNSPVQCTILDALLATLSDAQILPPVSIGEGINEFFVATTTGRCNPMEALLEEIPFIFRARFISVMASVGSGRLNPVSISGQGDFTNAVLDLAKSCHAVSQSMESRFSGHPGLFMRLDVDAFDHSRILHPGEVISHSRSYLVREEIRRHTDALIQSLKYRPNRLDAGLISTVQPGILERVEKTLNSVLSAEDSRILERLNVSTDAPFASFVSANIQRQSCTPGTRIAILQRLIDWATTLEPELRNSLFWLYGLAGTGKTTILRDICERLHKSGHLASSYFCSIQLSSGDSRHLVPTIARHLASRSPAFKSALVLQLQRDPDLFTATMKPQFEYLLCKPWKTAAHEGTGGVAQVVIIDALDECDRGEEFLSLLLDGIDNGQLEGVQFIVSSGPVPQLLAKVRTMRPDSPHVSLHEVPKDEIKGDIRRYLEANLILPSPQIDELVARADGLFIYASTLVKYLLISINSLYKEIVNVALSIDDEETRWGRWVILHAILCAAEPPSAEIIAELLGVDLHIVTAVVESLYSVLFTAGVGGPIYIFHASFHDFILSNSDGEFRCHPSRTHSNLAQGCITELTRSLRFNTCHLESSFVRDADLDPPLGERIFRYTKNSLSYSSRNWWIHIQKCDEKSRSYLLPHLEHVLEAKGIFWIEVMSLLGDIRKCKEVLMELISSSSIIRTAPALLQLASQAVKLISLFDTLPVKITSHLYLSCLALAEGTPANNPWICQFSALPQVTSQQLTANRHCQVVIDAGAPVCVPLLYLPMGSESSLGLLAWLSASGMLSQGDSFRIVSGSDDKTVCIWDAESGMQLRRLDGHTRAVNYVVLSPNGKRIVSGSDDKTVRIWDAESGRRLRKRGGHANSVRCVTFSPDGMRIVSGSNDKTLDGHTDPVLSVAFSPNGKLTVSGSDDKMVRIWDAASEKQTPHLEGHSGIVKLITFSPDIKRVTPAGYHSTVELSLRQRIVGILTSKRMSRLFSSKFPHPFLNPPSSSNTPLVPVPQPQYPVLVNTDIKSQTSPSLHCRDDGWLVTLKEETGEELLILWIPPFRRPFHPSILLAISREGFNSIDLAVCAFARAKRFRGMSDYWT